MSLLDAAILTAGSLPYVLFATAILKHGATQNGASYVLWVFLDAIFLACMIVQHGNCLQYLAITIGTAAVAIILILKKQFEYGWREFRVTLMVIACIAIFFFGGARIATIATALSIDIAGIPQVRDTWKNPRKTPTLGYLVLSLSGVLATCAVKSWAIQDCLAPINCAVFCFIIALLSMRRPKGFYK